MGLETDPQPDELFLQNSTAHYQQRSGPWETKATPTTIASIKVGAALHTSTKYVK